METTTGRPGKGKPGPLNLAAIGTLTVAAAALILAISLKPSSAGPTQLRLPSAVNGHNCLAVARENHLLRVHLTGKALGAYYAGWVKKLAVGQQITRATLFDAGLAVSVCLKAQ